MIEWAKEWLAMKEEERLEAAKKDAVKYHENKWLHLTSLPNLSRFLCNICRETKIGPPYGMYEEDYASRYYCQECLQKAGILW